MGEYLGLGWQIAAALGLATWGGIKLDKMNDSSPLFLLLFLLLAFISIGWNIYKLAKKMSD
jgi:F0F1-type ATP synthase assembly protein I